jgi:hypothetical protein
VGRSGGAGVFVEPGACPDCGGWLRFLAAIEDGAVIGRCRRIFSAGPSLDSRFVRALYG